jgi:hypothetical protein
MKINSDLTKIITKRHANKWVALSPDQKKVVAYAENLKSLTKKVGSQKVVYLKAPSPNIVYAF